MSEQRTLFQILIEDWARRRRASGVPLPEMTATSFGSVVVSRNREGHVTNVAVYIDPRRNETVMPPAQGNDLRSIDC